MGLLLAGREMPRNDGGRLWLVIVVFVASEDMRLIMMPAWRTGEKVFLLNSDDTQCRKGLLFRKPSWQVPCGIDMQLPALHFLRPSSHRSKTTTLHVAL